MNEQLRLALQRMIAFAKKHWCALFFCLLLLAAGGRAICSDRAWDLLAMAAGGVAGILMPGKVQRRSSQALCFVFQQEAAVQMVLALFAVICALFLSPLIFLCLGLQGGKSFHQQAIAAISGADHRS